MKKVFQRGNIDSFNKHLRLFKKQGETFKVEKSGMSRKIITPTKTFRFFGKDKSSFIKGSWNTNRVRKCIDRYIEKNGVPKKYDKPHIQVFNNESIKKNLNTPIGCIDVNACYWTTAMLLGYIDEKTYRIGLKEGNKMGLLVSIGFLNKKPLIVEYTKGKETTSYLNESIYQKYSPFYWKIISHTRDLYCALYNAIGDDMYMWITDCVFFKLEHRPLVEQILTEWGYNHKFYTSDFTYCNDYMVKWFDAKEGVEKTMSTYGRDIIREVETAKLFHLSSI